jgi:hypothetical protein
MSFRDWGLQVFQHVAVDAGRLLKPVHDPAGYSALDGFKLVGVLGCVRIPYRAGILESGADKGQIGAFLGCRDLTSSFCIRKPRVLFARLVTLAMWEDQLRSDAMVTPKYFASSTVLRVWPWS